MRVSLATNPAVTFCLLVAVACLIAAAYLSASRTNGPNQVTTPGVTTASMPHAFPAAD